MPHSGRAARRSPTAGTALTPAIATAVETIAPAGTVTGAPFTESWSPDSGMRLLLRPGK